MHDTPAPARAARRSPSGTAELRVDRAAVGGVAAPALKRAIRDLESQGFASIPLSPRLAQDYDELTAHARWFFGLADSDKAELDIRNSVGHRGWVPREEAGSYEDEGERRYEAFDIGRTAQPDDLDEHPLRGENHWPSSTRGQQMGRCAERTFSRLSALANLVGDAICDHLELPHTAIRRLRREPVSQLRLIHYLGANGASDPLIDLTEERPSEPAMGGHTDYEFFTLLFQAAPGTQVVDPAGEWRDLPSSGVVTLFAGDMLDVFSGGRFPSTFHRASAEVEAGRISIPFFAGADFSAEVRSADNDVQAVRFGDHLMRQLQRDFPYLRDGVLDLTEEPGPLSSFELDALRRATPPLDPPCPH